MSLEEILRKRIKESGPLSMAEFMETALGHPEYGYYMSRDPFGRGGDFTTAPEISQMFGEMIGVWVADVWQRIGAPEAFVMLECGPGRGTLMADLLRATKGVPGFHEACRVHLMEISPVLKGKQAEALQGYDVTWIEDLEEVGSGGPVMVVGNELLDALPIRQFEITDEGWAERCVDYRGDKFFITQGGVEKGVLERLGLHKLQAGTGSVFEVSEAQQSFVRDVSGLMNKRGGAALFIDYGQVQSDFGDTIQAVYKHKPCDIFDHVGDADLTAHVDFEALHKAADGMQSYGPVEQGEFLKALGIEVRAKALMQKANERQQKDILSALRRLTHHDEMGALFKVIGFTNDTALTLPGF